MSDQRCENCGCGLGDAAACPACGLARIGASVGAVAERRYDVAPLPAGPYEVELGIGDTLSWTFKMWWDNLPRLMALGFVPYALMLPFVILGGGLALSPRWAEELFSPQNLVWLVPAGCVLFVVFIVAGLSAAGGVVHLVDEQQHGVRVGAFAALLTGARHVGWLGLGWLLFSALMIFAVAGPALPIAVALDRSEAQTALFALPGLATVVVAMVIGARLAPAFPAIIVEDIGLGQAMSRAWSLTRGRTLTVLGASVLFMVAYFAMSMTAGLVGIVPILGLVAQLAISAMMAPLTYVFPFAVYAGCVRAEQRAQR